jgi:hypothetical protein
MSPTNTGAPKHSEKDDLKTALEQPNLHNVYIVHSDVSEDDDGDDLQKHATTPGSSAAATGKVCVHTSFDTKGILGSDEWHSGHFDGHRSSRRS